MRLDSFEAVGEFYVNHYGPLKIYEDCKGIHVVRKTPSMFTDLMVRIECLFQGIKNSLENFHLQLTTKTTESTKVRHAQPDGVIQNLQNLVAQGKNRVYLGQGLTRLEITESLSKAYFKAVCKPQEGLEKVFQIYAAEKMANTVLTGADVVLKGADAILDGANKFFEGLFA
jgi:hypothetical protein